MTHTIALNFTDGITRFITCNAGETVLDAAYRHQVNLPMDCSDGVCGTCRCHCEDGTYDQGDEYLEEALSEAEAAAGDVLTCQMVPSSNCVLQVPVASTACKTKPLRYGATVAEIARLSDSTICLDLALDAPEDLLFLPGQYINLTIPGTDQHRAYSMSSAPGQAHARFLIRNIPGGLMSNWLTATAARGNRMEFVGPQGVFYLRDADRPMILLAGGTGLAPILSMLDVLAERTCPQTIHLVYGVNTVADLVELPRLDALQGRLPCFTYQTCVVDPGSGHPRIGYVTDHLAPDRLNNGDCDVYLCGPPPMVDAVRAFLETAGITPENFYYEKFTPAGGPTP